MPPANPTESCPGAGISRALPRVPVISGVPRVSAATQFPRAARPAVDAVLPVTSPAPRQQDSQLNPRERVRGVRRPATRTSPLWLSVPPAKGQTRSSLRAVGAGRAGAPGLDSRGAVSPWGQEPCGSRSRPPTQRQAAGWALPSGCQAQRTFHWVQGSVTMATAGGGSRTPQNSEDIWGREEREREPHAGPGAAPSGSPFLGPLLSCFLLLRFLSVSFLLPLGPPRPPLNPGPEEQ